MNHPAITACCLILLLPATASAQARDRPNPVQQSDILSLRASAGLGIGSPPVGGRLGVEGEYWLTDLLGVGLEGALIGQAGFWGSAESSSGTIAPVVALRSSPRNGYVIFTAGAGYARVKHTGAYDCGLLAEDCPARRITLYDGYVIDLALGWLTHPDNSSFELGVGGRVDVVTDPHGATPSDFIITGNLAVGFGWLR